ncbi:MAG: aldehyde dehydrogenase family protein, partial [Thermoflexus sp.]
VLEAFRAAKAAQPGWAATPPPVRGQVIARIGRLVEANFEELAQLVTREVGKPIAEARGAAGLPATVAELCGSLPGSPSLSLLLVPIHTN